MEFYGGEDPVSAAVFVQSGAISIQLVYLHNVPMVKCTRQTKWVHELSLEEHHTIEEMVMFHTST